MSSKPRKVTPKLLVDPDADNHHLLSEQWGSWNGKDEDTQPRPIVRPRPLSSPSFIQSQANKPPAINATQQGFGGTSLAPAYREYVSRPVIPYAYPGALLQPPYPPFAGQPYYPAPLASHVYAPPFPAYPAYQGYPPYMYPSRVLQPKRDGYRQAIAIIALVGSSILFLGGLIGALIELILVVSPHTGTSQQNVSVLTQVLSFTCAGLLGGGCGFYHGIRSLLGKSSARFALPWFWIFAVLYLGMLGIGVAFRFIGQNMASPGLTIGLMVLVGIFPALAVLALGVRRVHFPRQSTWPTTWRRFTLALTSGATLGIGLAIILELILGLILVVVLFLKQSMSNPLCFSDPRASSCNLGSLGYVTAFILAAGIAPLVEETVKPLAIAVFMGRIQTAAEAFILGLAAGIGFDLIETVGYISSAHQDWLNVAFERSGAGLLHGFGAGMVALGWYYLTRSNIPRHVLRAFACWIYAVVQHAIWNGSAVVTAIPGPVSDTLNRWSVHLGSVTITATDDILVINSLLIFAFFLYMTRKVRTVPPQLLP